MNVYAQPRSRVPRARKKVLLLAAFLLPLAGGAAWLAATWNAFPGGWVKNRVGMGGGKVQRAEERYRNLLASQRLPGPPAKVSVLIRKGERRLILYGDGRELYRCRVGLGKAPVRHKEREGDQRTPEGDYYVCTRNAETTKFDLFLGLSYPNAADAKRGLELGWITKEQHLAISEAIAAGRQPPWNTPLGGFIGVHGSGSNWDWTHGCIGLNDPDIETIWNFCKLGTPVRIEP